LRPDLGKPAPTLLAENGLRLVSRGGPLTPEERETAVAAAIARLTSAGPPTSPSTIAAALHMERDRLFADMKLGAAWELAGRLTALTDGAVACLMDWALAQADIASCPVALVATGGYGRAELFPWSDVDLAVVPARPDDPGLDAFVRALHKAVFDCFGDGVGLDVGYQFRPTSDLPTVDDKTLTSFLDSRPVCGDKAVFAEFQAALNGCLDPARSLPALVAERAARGLERTGRVYALEADLKAHPGGMRDLCFALWIARVALGTGAPMTLSGLREAMPLSHERYARAMAGVSGLADLRFALHLCSGRKTDTLYTSRQEAVGTLLFEPGEAGVNAALGLRFASGCEVSALAQQTVEFFVSGRRRLDHGLILTGGRIARSVAGSGATGLFTAPEQAAAPGLSGTDAQNALRLQARTGAPLTAALKRDIAESATRFTPVEEALGAKAVGELLDSPSAATALRLMRDLGLLPRLVPEIAGGIGATPYDPSHEFSICEHSLRVVDNLFELAAGSSDLPAQLARLWTGLSRDDRRVLVLAAFLHDMGKPAARRDHSRAGAGICAKVGERLRLSTEDTELAAKLIELHLVMAHRSRTLDLDQEVTIRNFAEVVGDLRTLNLLYLLTYADTTAVGLGVFGDIERRLLDDLYARTVAAFAEEGMTDKDLRATAERITARAIAELHVAGVSDDRIREHCEEMPPFYVVSTPLPVMGMHIAMVRDLTQRDEPLIDFYTKGGEKYTELTICCYDDPEPGLFSRIAAALLALGINLHSAQIRTRHGRRNVVLDTLMVDFRGDALTPDMQDRTRTLLADVLLGRTSGEELLIKRGRRLPVSAVIHDLLTRNDMSDDHTVVWVTVEDKTGLLYRLTRALSVCRLNLHTAKITSWGGSAQNVFYVTRAEGGKVADGDLEPLRARLREAIQDIPAVIRDTT